MMATMLQIPQEQLVELLSSLDANVGDLFEETLRYLCGTVLVFEHTKSFL